MGKKHFCIDRSAFCCLFMFWACRSLSSQWFLTIVAKNQLFLAVILESRHSIDNNEASSLAANNHTGPSRFYIDEIQDTLDHLQTGGVENLATTWLNANKRPEVLRCILVALIESHII